MGTNNIIIESNLQCCESKDILRVLQFEFELVMEMFESRSCFEIYVYVRCRLFGPLRHVN